MMRRTWMAALCLVALMLAGPGMTAGAASAPKPLDVSLAQQANPDGSYTLVASAQRQGSDVTVSWPRGIVDTGVIQQDGDYVDTAFTPVACGTHTVTVWITETAGNSDVSWSGSATTMIVGPDCPPANPSQPRTGIIWGD